MSRVMVFDLQNQLAGEVRGFVDRGWAIGDGGSTSITLPANQSSYEWLQLGRYVAIDHPKLPLWTGMIDTPWNAIVPIKLSLYEVPYAFSLRSVKAPVDLTGDAGYIVERIIEKANYLEEMYIRPGNIYRGGMERTETIKPGSMWDQLKTVVKNAGLELIFRSEIQSDGKLIIYVDLQEIIGGVDDFVLQDGEGGNCQITSASADGDIVNRLIASSDESTEASRKKTEYLYDDASIALYRTRNQVKLFSGIKSQSQLEENGWNYLKLNAQPKIILTMNALDIGDTFYHLRVGNTLTLRGTRLMLPGGKIGWSGPVRITAMNYDENKNTVIMTVEGRYE